MKKKLTIRIKDPRLRKVRNELRKLLHEAESMEVIHKIEMQSKLKESPHFWDKEHPQYSRLRKEAQKLASEVDILETYYDSSIIKCPVCMRIDKDMTYNPVLKEWLCVECYEANRKFEIAQGRPDLYP